MIVDWGIGKTHDILGSFLDPCILCILEFLLPLNCSLIFFGCLKITLNIGQVAQLVGVSSHTPKGCGFKSQSGHISRLLGDLWSRFIQEATDWCFSFTSMFLLSLCLSVPPLIHLLLSLKSTNIFLGEDYKIIFNYISNINPGWNGSVNWVPACEPKGCWFNSCQVTCLCFGPGPQLGVCKGQPHIDVSLPIFCPPFLSL